MPSSDTSFKASESVHSQVSRSARMTRLVDHEASLSVFVDGVQSTVPLLRNISFSAGHKSPVKFVSANLRSCWPAASGSAAASFATNMIVIIIMAICPMFLGVCINAFKVFPF